MITTPNRSADVTGHKGDRVSSRRITAPAPDKKPMKYPVGEVIDVSNPVSVPKTPPKLRIAIETSNVIVDATITFNGPHFTSGTKKSSRGLSDNVNGWNAFLDLDAHCSHVTFP